MRLYKNLYLKSEEIAEYLGRFLNLQVEEGAYDPLESRLIRNSYGNIYFSLLCALLYKKTRNKKWLDNSVVCLKAELEWIANRSSIPGVFRWEFKNYALISIYDLLKDDIDKNLKRSLRIAIRNWQDLSSFQTNWFAMRAVNYLLRYKIFNSPRDLNRSKKELKVVLNRQLKYGFIPDDLESYSFQYHSYTTALLCQYYSLHHSSQTKDRGLKKAILKAVDFISTHITPEGDFCYFGRGQKQIFGYASTIYSLVMAYRITGEKNYLDKSMLVFEYTNKYPKNTIVLNNKEKQKAGWYKYNSKLDYITFFGVLLFLCSEICYTNKNLRIARKRINDNANKSNTNCMVIATGGNNSSEIPGVAAIFPKILPCQGGPPIFISRDKRCLAQCDYSQNFFGPKYKSSNPLYKKTATEITQSANSIALYYDLEDFGLRYSFEFNNGIKLRFTIIPKKSIQIMPLHIACFRKPECSIKLNKNKSVLTPDGEAIVYESEKIRISKPFSYSIHLIKNNKKSKIILFPEFPTLINNKSTKIIYRLRKLSYLGSSIIKKLFVSPMDFFLSFRYYKSTKDYYCLK